MTSKIKYYFFTHNKEVLGQIKSACNGKKAVYDGFKDRVDCYSHNYNVFSIIAVFRLKSWKSESLSNTLINEGQSFAA